VAIRPLEQRFFRNRNRRYTDQPVDPSES
jgi:hypothetical protein